MTVSKLRFLVSRFLTRMQGLSPEASHVATTQYAGILVKLLKTML